MNEFRADLHCHTTCSDGTTSPSEIVKLASQIGLSGLSITDHDSIDAYSVAIPLSKTLGIEMISGCEFSTVHKGVSIHLLAYSFPLDDPKIDQFCKKHNVRRENRNRDILKLLANHKMPVTEEEIAESMPLDLPKSRRTIGRPHIAQAMIKKGYVESIQEAFRKYLGEGKMCYAPGESFSSEETLNLIHEAKGLAVIAHPHLIKNRYTLNELLEMKFDGLECFYAKFPMDVQKKWLKMAEKKALLVTGGSDYHGNIKPNLALGSSWINQEFFSILQKHYLEQTQNKS